jgi:hypothetical protein
MEKTEVGSPLQPLVKHLAEHKSMPALYDYIDSVEACHDDWGIFVLPSNPIHDYKVGYVQFHYGEYQLIATLAELDAYPHDGKAFCSIIPDLLNGNSIQHLGELSVA